MFSPESIWGRLTRWCHNRRHADATMLNACTDAELMAMARPQMLSDEESHLAKALDAMESACKGGERWEPDLYTSELTIRHAALPGGAEAELTPQQRVWLHEQYLVLDGVAHPEAAGGDGEGSRRTRTYAELWALAVEAAANGDVAPPAAKEAAPAADDQSPEHKRARVRGRRANAAQNKFGISGDQNQTTETGAIRLIEYLSEPTGRDWLNGVLDDALTPAEDSMLSTGVQPAATELKTINIGSGFRLEKGSWFLARYPGKMWFGQVRRMFLHKGPDGVHRPFVLAHWFQQLAGNRGWDTDLEAPVVEAMPRVEGGKMWPASKIVPWPCLQRQAAAPGSRKLVMLARHWHVLELL
jgi:hypothetical protein